MVKIRERKEDKACFKCWENGHWQRECKGMDKRDLCMNCGNAAHKAASYEAMASL